jgi:hypothetical protein
MSIIFPVNTEAVSGFTVSVAHGAVVNPTVVVHLEMLLHVAHMTGHFVADETLNAFHPTLLPRIL